MPKIKFKKKPVTVFKLTKDIKELIGNNKIRNNVVERINKNNLKPEKYFLWLGNSQTVSWNQAIVVYIFKSQQIKKTCKMFHKVNCSTSYLTHLVEYTLSKKQHTAKVETTFNIRLNNYMNDVKSPHPKSILAWKHFQNKIITSIDMQNSLS